MKVSVVIPAYNEEEFIQKSLDGLMRQEVMPDEIIVVDNNSTDKTGEIAQKYPQVRVVHEQAQGMTPARNKGFDSAHYEIIARTDADTIVPVDWIKRIKEHFAKDETLVGLAGPAILHSNHEGKPLNKLQSKLFFRSFNSSFHYMTGHDVLLGPNMAIRKSAWEKIKNTVCLDDKKVHEDVDLSLHLSKVGNILFDYHLIVNSSSRRLGKLKTYYEYPYRYLKTIQIHLLIFDRKKMMKQVNPGRLLKNKYTRKFLQF